MNRLKLALCDGDGVYCQRLDDYLHGNLKLSFDISSFTGTSMLCDYVKDEEISLLIISERLFNELYNSRGIDLFKNIIVLDEGDNVSQVQAMSKDETRIIHVNKFQEASRIVAGIIDFCVNSPEEFGGINMNSSAEKGNIYGFYSPIGKCGQTTMAREVAKRLSAKGKTVFLSFESFSSLPFLLGTSENEDMTDLLYYAECDRSKLGLYLEKIKISRDGVDYIIPPRTSMQLRDIKPEKMRELLEILISDAGYAYVVLDMTDYPDGFLDIMLLCKKIITIVRENPVDAFRQKQYEGALLDSGYDEIQAKTQKLLLPDIRDKKAFEACISNAISGEEP